MATVWKYGLGMGLLTCLYVMGEYWLGFHGGDAEIGRYTGYLASLIPIVGLFLGLRRCRDHELGGMMDLGQAFRAGMGMTLLLALVTASFFAFYYSYVNPGANEVFAELTRSSLEKSGASAEEIERQVAALLASQTPFRQFTLSLGTTLGFGALLSLVLGLFLRRPR